MREKIVIIVILFVVSGNLCFAQADKRDCLENFNIEGLNLNEGRIKDHINDLVDYVECRSILTSDIRECERLDPKNSKKCKKHYNEIHGFYVELLISGVITPKVLSACQVGGGGKETCLKIAKAFLKGDVSLCDNATQKKEKDWCLAIISLNENSTNNNADKETVLYIKAIRSMNVKACNSIKDLKLRRECKAFITGDDKICEECEGFKKFKNKYCSELRDK